MVKKLAVVGAGVSGLTAAYLLARDNTVTLFEADDRLGGHAHTQWVSTGSTIGEAGSTTDGVAVDTGFIVHNDRTYPHLLRLFEELDVATQPCEMSMSISDPATGLEYAGGRGLAGFVALPRQLLRRDYVAMLLSVKRFHKVATQFLAETNDGDTTTFGEFIERHNFSDPFVKWYAVPLVSCVWSTGSADSLDYPARYLFRFLEHHGMLSVGNSPRWRTVTGGSAQYVEAIASRLDDVRRGVAVKSLLRNANGVEIATDQGVEQFDGVVIATHPDQALRLLGDSSDAEREVLGAFRYSSNPTVLHSDPSFLPKARGARASWNFRVPPAGQASPPVVTYWMNRLMQLPVDQPLLVTLNSEREIDERFVHSRMDYAHPVYDLAAVKAQRRLPELTTSTTTYAGAWQGWGFHEDGCRSGVEAAAAFGTSWGAP